MCEQRSQIQVNTPRRPSLPTPDPGEHGQEKWAFPHESQQRGSCLMSPTDSCLKLNPDQVPRGNPLPLAANIQVSQVLSSHQVQCPVDQGLEAKVQTRVTSQARGAALKTWEPRPHRVVVLEKDRLWAICHALWSHCLHGSILPAVIH